MYELITFLVGIGSVFGFHQEGLYSLLFFTPLLPHTASFFNPTGLYVVHNASMIHDMITILDSSESHIISGHLVSISSLVALTYPSVPSLSLLIL